jgi:hypothetical protein
MRPLTEEETRAVFEKLYKFIGRDIKALIERSDGAYCFRLHRNRVYYVSEALMRRATNVARDKLVHLGACIGKLTHSGKFRLTIGALGVLAQYAKHKVCVAFRFAFCVCVLVCVCAHVLCDSASLHLAPFSPRTNFHSHNAPEDRGDFSLPPLTGISTFFSSFHRGVDVLRAFCVCAFL